MDYLLACSVFLQIMELAKGHRYLMRIIVMPQNPGVGTRRIRTAAKDLRAPFYRDLNTPLIQIARRSISQKLGRDGMKVTATNSSLRARVARAIHVRDIAIRSDISMRYSIRPGTFEGA
jgi:hypothetical protein